VTAPEEVSSAMDGDEPVAGYAVADILNLGFDAHLRELPQRPALSLATST